MWVPWAYFLVLLVIAIDMKFGIYGRSERDYFCETKHFFYRRCIKVSDIGQILYKPKWIFGGNMKSIYIIDKKVAPLGLGWRTLLMNAQLSLTS